MIQLIIQDNNDNWKELDIKDVEIVLHKSFQNLENPSSIESAYTLNVELPFTEQNNNILGDIYRLDFTQGSFTFDQRKKYKFKLLNDEWILYEGDFVLDNIVINSNSENNYYHVTLYDELYNIFKKIDYSISEPQDSLEPNVDKKININAFNKVFCNASLVTNTLKGGNRFDSILQGHYVKQTISNSNADNYIGFIPTYAKFSDFSYDKVCKVGDDGTGVIKLYKDANPTLPKFEYEEFETNAWKSYHLKPYIYYNNLMEFIFSEIYRTTGYTVDTSKSNFFSITNPYWANLIFTLKYPQHNKDVEKNYNDVFSFLLDDYNNKLIDHIWANNTDYTLKTLTTDFYYDINNLNLENNYKLQFNADINLAYYYPAVDFELTRLNINEENILEFNVGVNFFHDNVNILSKQHNIDIKSSNSDLTLSEDSVVYDTSVYNNVSKADDYDRILLSGQNNACYYYKHNHPTNLYDVSGNIIYPEAARSISATINLTKEEISDLQYNNVNKIQLVIGITKYRPDKYITYNHTFNNRNAAGVSLYLQRPTFTLQEYSKPLLSFQNLLGEDFNILTAFTNFIKRFNLLCDVDYRTKKINLYQKGEYFERESKILDWTNYIDLKNGVESTNITSNYKGINYDYDDRDTFFNNVSNLNKDVNNNTKTIKLPFNINTDSYDYLSGQNNSTIRQIIGYWLGDYGYNNIRSTHKNNLILYDDCDVDGNSLEEVTGQLLFRNWNDFDLNMFRDIEADKYTKWFEIQDDTPVEINNNTYCYNNARLETKYVKKFNTLPNISTYYFKDQNPPDPTIKINNIYNDNYKKDCYLSEWDYTGFDGNWDTERGIYNIFHKDWNYFLYESNSKLIDATFYLPLEEYYDFSFNKLIIIENNLYLLIEIDEYSFNNQIMKAKLLQVRNRNLLTNYFRFSDNYLFVVPSVINAERYVIGDAESNIRLYNFKVFSKYDYQIEYQYNKPLWLNNYPSENEPAHTLSGNYSSNITQINTALQTNSSYPNDQDNIYWFYKIKQQNLPQDTEDHIMEKNLGVTNIIKELDYSSLIVEPDYFNIINENNYGRHLTILIETTSDINYSFSSNNVIINPVIRKEWADNNQIQLTIMFDTVIGVEGETDVLNIVNETGQTGTCSFVRAADYSCEITDLSGVDYPTFVLDWTKYDKCLKGHIDFMIKCGTDWNMFRWFQHCFDGTYQEYPFSVECEDGYPNIESLDTGVVYKPDMDEIDYPQGVAGSYYRFRLNYYRKWFRPNESDFNGHIIVYKEHPKREIKRQTIIALNENNT